MLSKRIHDQRQLRAFIAAIAPLGFLTSGCDSPIGEFDAKLCLREADAFADLVPADGTDFVALREQNDFGIEPGAQEIQTWGARCATASDGAACSADLAALPLDPPLRRSGIDAISSFDLVFTRGDEVGRVDDKAGLLDLLGVIDAPSEAVLVAFAEGHDLTCEENNWRAEGTSFVLLATEGTGCGDDVVHYEVTVDAAGNVTKGEEDIVEHGDDNCAIGRRPDGLCSRTHKARSVGRFFAHAAHLEAASVHAFAQLAGELAAHGAPRKLVEAAWRARADEIRHARATAALARRFGAEPVRPIVGPRRVRRLFEVAYDNGTEGCVRETFGALVATAQARRAAQPLVRRTLRPIAADETRHALLSWAIDGWMHGKLSPRERRAVAEGRAEAAAVLRAETARGWSPSITRAAGMPTAEAALRMLEPIDAALWRA